MTYAKIASWHIVGGTSRTTGRLITLCGKQTDGPAEPMFPFRERSCEACLRLQAKKESTP